MIKVEVSEPDIQAVIARCTKIEQVLKDDSLNREVADVLLRKIQERFMKQENADGSKWRPSLAAQMRQAGIPRMGSDKKYYTGGATYFASGSLFRSLGITKVGNGMSVGTSYYVAGDLHDKDGREIVGVGETDMTLMTEVVMKRIQNV